MNISLKRVVLYLCAIIVFIYFLLPPSWMVITSFMTEKESIAIPPHFYPQEPTLENYSRLVKPTGGGLVEDMPRSFLNSAKVAFGVTFLNLFLGSLAAYASARLNFRGNVLLLFFYLATRMAPPIVLMLPMYLIIFRTGLLDKPLALILVYTSFTLPFTIWMLRGYFQTIPRDLEDAARVDRCNWANMMVRVFLPIAAPGLVAAGVFSFLSSWSEFLYAAVFTTTMASRTMPVMVAQFSYSNFTRLDRPLIMASGVLALIPPVILAVVFQRLIVRGLVAGAVKG